VGCILPGPGIFGFTTFYGGFIVGGGFTFLKRDGARGADRETVPQTVTVVVAQQPCTAIYHTDCTLMTGFNAQSTAITFFLVDVYYFTQHIQKLLLVFVFWLDFLR